MKTTVQSLNSQKLLQWLHKNNKKNSTIWNRQNATLLQRITNTQHSDHSRRERAEAASFSVSSIRTIYFSTFAFYSTVDVSRHDWFSLLLKNVTDHSHAPIVWERQPLIALFDASVAKQKALLGLVAVNSENNAKPLAQSNATCASTLHGSVFNTLEPP